VALVVDSERSEISQQRRRNAAGRTLHCCCICGKLDTWGDGWSTYCSYRDMDDATPIPKFCSEGCRYKGGPAADAVTDEMKRRANDAEWRDPNIVYRPQTDREKYFDAAHAQRKPTLLKNET